MRPSETTGLRVGKIAAIRTGCKKMLARLDQTGEDQVSPTGPESRAMLTQTVGPGKKILDIKTIEAVVDKSDIEIEDIEHPFGNIKQRMNQGAFLMQGLEKVRAEFSPTGLAYDP